MRAFFAEGQVQTNAGEKLHLVCDFFALDIVEQVTGENWDDIRIQLGEDKPPRALIIKLLYALLRKRHEDITLDEAAAVYHDCNLPGLFWALGDVIQRASNFAGDAESDDATEETGKKKSDGQSQGSEGNG